MQNRIAVTPRPVAQSATPLSTPPTAPTVSTPADSFARPTGTPRLALTSAAPFVPLAAGGGAIATSGKVQPLELGSAEATRAAEATVAVVRDHLPAIGAQDSWVSHSATRDELGLTHVRLNRQHNGLPVFGEQVVGHLDAEGKVTSVNGLVGEIPEGLGRGAPAITAADAARRIERAFGIPAGSIPPSEMIRNITRGNDGKYRDAWQIQDIFANASGKRINSLLDAETGEVLNTWESRHGIVDERAMERAKQAVEAAGGPRAQPLDARDTEATGEGNDTSLYSGKVEVGGTDLGGGRQSMLDTTRGQGIETNDAQGRTRDNPAPVQLVDNNGAWGEASDPRGHRTAVDAQFGAQMTSDFLRDLLGRDSLDGRGEKLLSTVNVRLEDANGNLAPNAFWNGEQMTYGIGDGVTFSDLTTVDIAGHEIAHGLTERTAGLIYRNESGGLNESISDIIGAGVEWYASQRNANVEFNWKVGEDAFTPGLEGDALRFMDDPTRDGYSIDHFSQMGRYRKDDGIGQPESDNGGVHGSSGIMNNAFFLLTEGGTNRTSGQGVAEGIGMESSLKIFSRALQFYMVPNSTFAQAREATLLATNDLFGAGSPEAAKLKQAWSAVGVE